jgi:hypothetical protein
MDLFDYLRNGKMNTFEEVYASTSVYDMATIGSRNNNPFFGLLGMFKKVNDAVAGKFSDTTIGTLKNGVYQLVRSKAGGVAADWVKGRPLFWSNKSQYEVTTVAANTSEYAGQALGPLTTPGNFKIMQIDGDAPVLFAAALTKAVPVLGDPVTFLVAANLAAGDVELDATGWNNAIVKRWIGYLQSAPVTAGQSATVNLANSRTMRNNGIFT